MDEPRLKKDTHLHRNQLIMRHTVSIVYEINQRVILFDRRQPCRKNLLRLKCKLNL